MSTRATFHLADMVFEPHSITAFAGVVHNRFARFGVTEQQIWHLRGYGYGVGLAVREVDDAIRAAAERRGIRIHRSEFEKYPGGA